MEKDDPDNPIYNIIKDNIMRDTVSGDFQKYVIKKLDELHLQINTISEEKNQFPRAFTSSDFIREMSKDRLYILTKKIPVGYVPFFVGYFESAGYTYNLEEVPDEGVFKLEVVNLYEAEYNQIIETVNKLNPSILLNGP